MRQLNVTVASLPCLARPSSWCGRGSAQWRARRNGSAECGADWAASWELAGAEVNSACALTPLMPKELVRACAKGGSSTLYAEL